jgi:hypothetical protein
LNESAEETLEQLPDPRPIPRRRGAELAQGLSLAPEEKLAAFPADRLELVVSYWLREGLSERYPRVRRVGGTGDKGRDVVAFHSAEANDPWDNYQAKAYENKLTPTAIWPELCKLVYYSTRGDYSLPDTYYFVAPKGVGAKAQDLLDDVEALRAGLLKDWGKHGKTLCPLADIKAAVEKFAFPKFDIADGSRIVDDLKGQPSYAVFFGGGLTKPRPEDATPPAQIDPSELKYISELVAAYDDHCSDPVASAGDAFAHPTYGPHLKDSRQDFYCAETLRAFSKDVLAPPDDYQALQDQIYHGVKHTVSLSHADGYERVLKVCEQATRVELDDHPLRPEVKPQDRSGMCHQLANDGKVTWTP